ncbi:pyridoxal phosphate-dependent aminotransferase [Candidatus Parcubacteria bacterium]|nr:MAG: pyridoxal phosphate-dependent aminotransferase [Candidatus Parcubacteria bacterium]
MQISKRVSEMIASPLRKFIPYAEIAKKKGIKVYHLNIGQPDLPTPKKILSAVKNFKEKVVPYTHSAGIIELRQAWADYFATVKIHLKPAEILITTGGSEAMLYSLLLMLNPGEEMMVFEPFYSNYKSLAKITGVQLVPVTVKVEENFSLPKNSEIEKKISPKTRAILIVNPNNPTGTVYPKKDLQRIALLAKKHGLWVLADETYREIVFENARPASLINFKTIEKQVILIDSVSKRLSFCGGRIGCLASKNPEVIANCLKLNQSRLASPTIEQKAVIQLLSDPTKYTDGLKREYHKRSEIVYSGLQKIPGAVCRKPQGAFYIIARLPIDDSEKFVRWMLERFSYRQETVMVAPAKDFYATPGKGTDEVRIAYVLNTTELKKAMMILRLGILEYQKQMPKQMKADLCKSFSAVK